MNRTLKTAAACVGLAIAGFTSAHAQDAGPLLDTLVRKGLINDQEAEELRAEMMKDYSAQPGGKLNLSSSVTQFRISGDVRFRFQHDNEVANNQITNPDASRSRYRYRFRVGFTANMVENWTVGLRFESANGATSTNQDFGDDNAGSGYFNKTNDTVKLGQVFLQYQNNNFLGFDKVDFRIGKHAHPFFNPGVNGFWIDSDINPEGLSQELALENIGGGDMGLVLRFGEYLAQLNDRRNGLNENLLLIGQAEFNAKLGSDGKQTLKIAPTVVIQTGGETSTATDIPRFIAGEANFNHLSTLLLPVEYGTTLFGKPFAAYATIGYNLEGKKRTARFYGLPEASAEDLSLLGNAGVRWGAAKAKGDLQIVLEYRYIETGSYTRNLLDSDFNAGWTNAAGPIASASYLFTDYLTGTVTFFRAENIDGDAPLPGPVSPGTTANTFLNKADVLQVDLSAKF